MNNRDDPIFVIGIVAMVYETGSVNELQVENLSPDETIFIQAGDIVKGGRQDRTLAEDLILKPRSGKVQIGAFCVEHGRWQPRGAEASSRFESSQARVNSKGLKIALMAKKDQGEVWNEVAQVQEDLQKNLGKSVKNKASATSLQLTLEDKSLKEKNAVYSAALSALVHTHADARGYVLVINNQINAGDIYVTHELFEKRWTSLLDASVNEALATFQAGQIQQRIEPAVVLNFVKGADSGTVKDKSARGESISQLRENSEAHVYEGLRASDGKWMHRSYLKR